MISLTDGPELSYLYARGEGRGRTALRMTRTCQSQRRVSDRVVRARARRRALGETDNCTSK